MAYSAHPGADRTVLELFTLVYLPPLLVASVAEDVVILLHPVFVGGAVRVMAYGAYTHAYRAVDKEVFSQAPVAFEAAPLHTRAYLLFGQRHLMTFLTVFLICRPVECIRRIVAGDAALDLG